MKSYNLNKFISFGGLLTSLTVIFQCAPVFLQTIGLMFSPFSTLFIAIASSINILLGLSVLISSCFIVSLISLQELLILLFTTGLFGFIIGICYRKGLIITLTASSVTLFFGIVTLTYIISFASFTDFSNQYPLIIIITIFLIFSIVYSLIWSLFLNKIFRYLRNININI